MTKQILFPTDPGEIPSYHPRELFNSQAFPSEMLFINGLDELYIEIRWEWNLHTIKSKESSGTFLVVQWLRIRLPMQGTWVRALVREDPTCHGATKPLRHNY